MATVFDRVGALLGRKSEARTVLSVQPDRVTQVVKSADGSLRLANEGDGKYELVKLEDETTTDEESEAMGDASEAASADEAESDDEATSE